MHTTASQDFAGNNGAYAAANEWDRKRLLLNSANNPENAKFAPYVACAEYRQGRDARSRLEDAFGGPSNVQAISYTEAHGACFVATVAPSEAEALIKDPSAFGVKTAGPFASVLKIAPGLIEHGPSIDGGHDDLATIGNRQLRS